MLGCQAALDWTTRLRSCRWLRHSRVRYFSSDSLLSNIVVIYPNLQYHGLGAWNSHSPSPPSRLNDILRRCSDRARTMDPLSITASSIAVLGAVTSTSKGIGKLVSLRTAAVELQALSNEAEAFRSLLVIVQSSLRHIQGSDIYQEHGEALCNLLSNAKEAALELQCKIEYELKRGVEIDQNGLPKVSRTAWLRSSGEIEKLRQRINNARTNLSTGLQAIDLRLM